MDENTKSGDGHNDVPEIRLDLDSDVQPTAQPDNSSTSPAVLAPVKARNGASGKPAPIQVMLYGPNGLTEHDIFDPEELRPLIGSNAVIWVNVDDLSNHAVVAKIAELFSLHPLAVEDVMTNHQLTKAEAYEQHLYVVTRMVSLTRRLEMEQLNMFLGKNYVLTLQGGKTGDCLQQVRDRVHKSTGKIRTDGPDHLAYAILDAVIDNYFPVLNQLGDRLDDLEDEILVKHDNRLPSKIHAIKRDIRGLRRSIWPLRDMLNTMIRDNNRLISADTRIYLRDCHDHCLRVIDLVEVGRELCSDLMDLHLSSTSNRMNQVMKVLTIITTLFIPPTFIAGIYGMNFDNMPELKWLYGYPFALGIMFVMVLGLLMFLRSQGWLQREEFRERRAERKAAKKDSSQG